MKYNSKYYYFSLSAEDMEINLNIGNSDGSSHLLEQKKCIKYLGVMIDESLTWKYHIAFICSRHYLPIQQLKQLYYNLIYPYMSYSILAWGSVYKTHIKKIQVKQNHNSKINVLL